MDESDNQEAGPLVVTNKAGQSFVVDGEQYKRWDNGAVYDTQAGRIVANPGGGSKAITQANTSDIRSKWFERKLAGHLAAGRGLALGTGSAEELEAVTKLTANMAEMAMDPSRGRVAVEAYRASMAAAGFGAPDSRQDAAAQPAGNTLTLTDDSVAGLLALVAAWREQAGE